MSDIYVNINSVIEIKRFVTCYPWVFYNQPLADVRSTDAGIQCLYCVCVCVYACACIYVCMHICVCVCIHHFRVVRSHPKSKILIHVVVNRFRLGYYLLKTRPNENLLYKGKDRALSHKSELQSRVCKFVEGFL